MMIAPLDLEQFHGNHRFNAVAGRGGARSPCWLSGSAPEERFHLSRELAGLVVAELLGEGSPG